MSDAFRVLVCGGRDFTDREQVFFWLDYLHAKRTITTLIHGAATGADTLADEWAKARGVEPEPYEVTREDWDRYGNRAGNVRNEQMLREGKPHMVVAFAGGSGTRHMVSIARRDGRAIWDLRFLTK